MGVSVSVGAGFGSLFPAPRYRRVLVFVWYESGARREHWVRASRCLDEAREILARTRRPVRAMSIGSLMMHEGQWNWEATR